MNDGVRDPIKDLMKEIAAESPADDDQDDAEEQEAAPKKKPATVREPAGDDEDEPESDEDDESDEEEEDEEVLQAKKDKDAKDEKKAKDDKKSKARYVPVARVNEEAAKRRIAERLIGERDDRIRELEAAAKDGKTPLTAEERKSIGDAIRTQERVRLRAETMVEVGYETYGQKEFDDASKSLADLGAPDEMILIALESCGSSALAARALFNLAQEDPEEVEAILKMSPLRLAAKLAHYSTKRKAVKAEEPDDEENEDDEVEEEEVRKPAPKKKAAGKTKETSRAPAPAKMPRGTNRGDPDAITDDLSEDDFTERFDRLMNKKTGRHA